LWERLYNGIILSTTPFSGIIFSKSAIRKFKKFATYKDNTHESGGLLLGYIRGDHFDVETITTPYKNDKFSQFSFERNDRKHLEKLKKKYGITYIGEWHTHPEDVPFPSPIDILEWNTIKSTRNYPLVFLILGFKGYYITIL
jgi:integrative and conjugative element protein (TIGR02256 family)